MSAASEAELRWVNRVLLVAVPLLAPAFDFVLLWATYRVVAATAPGVLGEVAGSPARFAAWVAVVKLPLLLAWLAAVSGRRFRTMMTTGEVPDPPERSGWRRVVVGVRDQGIHIAVTAVAALIVFDQLADPVGARTWPLVAVSAAGPYLLPKPVSGLWALISRRWRRRVRHRGRHGTPDED